MRRSERIGVGIGAAYLVALGVVLVLVFTGIVAGSDQLGNAMTIAMFVCAALIAIIVGLT